VAAAAVQVLLLADDLYIDDGACVVAVVVAA